jgi:hypothetical protein
MAESVFDDKSVPPTHADLDVATAEDLIAVKQLIAIKLAH